MDKISMTQHLIKGCKGGSSSPRTPTEQPDDLQSVAKAKILIALGEVNLPVRLPQKIFTLMVRRWKIPTARKILAASPGSFDRELRHRITSRGSPVQKMKLT